MKKRIFSAFLAILMVVLILPVSAFAETKTTKEIKGAFVGLKYDSVFETVLGAKAYSKSGEIPEGLKLTGSWAYKNAYGDYVMKMGIAGTPTKAGTYNFSVTYYDEDGKSVFKANYTMIVGAEAPFDFVTSITIDKWPKKLDYYLGDTVDLTGMEVSAVVYKFNKETNLYEPKEVDVTDLVWVEPAIFTSDEAPTVEVFLKAPGDQHGNMELFSDYFRVKFKYANPNDVVRIEIYKKPEKLTYTVGETLDTTGMTVRVHKGDGSAEDITEGFKTDVTKLEEAGTKTVTVTYGEGEKAVSATFDVTVNEKVEEPVSSSSSSSEEEPSSSSSSSEPEPEVPSESEPEVPSESESEPEVPSESESEPEVPSESESEPEVPSEPESEPEEIEVIGGDVEEPEEKGGIPVWAWIIIVLLVVLIAAAVALFIIGRRRIED